MIGFLAGAALARANRSPPRELSDFTNPKSTEHINFIKKINTITVCTFFEMAIYITAIVIAHLITANTLPKALEFLKGRMQLATAMMATSITLLALPSFIYGAGFLSKKMVLGYL